MTKNRLLGLFILIIVGTVINQCTSADRDSSGEITKSGDVKVTDMRVGDCFIDIPNVTDETIQLSTVKAIPCSEPHSWQVFHKSNVMLEEYSLDALTEETTRICGDATDALISTLNDLKFNEYRTADINISQPTSSSWAKGDRVTTCLIGSDSQTYYTSILD